MGVIALFKDVCAERGSQAMALLVRNAALPNGRTAGICRSQNNYPWPRYQSDAKVPSMGLSQGM